MIKKMLVSVAIAGSLATGTLLADQLKFLPFTDSSYSPNFAVAALGGYEKANSVKGSGAYGVELSLKCFLLQLPSHTIRQQISLVHTNADGLSTTSFELNPHVLFGIAHNLTLGVGPSFGAIYASANSQDHFVYGIGGGASLTYNITPQYFVGLQSRYQWTSTAHLGGRNFDLDNLRTLAKVGVYF
jgi:hypothetical protein